MTYDKALYHLNRLKNHGDNHGMLIKGTTSQELICIGSIGFYKPMKIPNRNPYNLELGAVEYIIPEEDKSKDWDVWTFF